MFGKERQCTDKGLWKQKGRRATHHYRGKKNPLGRFVKRKEAAPKNLVTTREMRQRGVVKGRGLTGEIRNLRTFTGPSFRHYWKSARRKTVIVQTLIWEEGISLCREVRRNYGISVCGKGAIRFV